MRVGGTACRWCCEFVGFDCGSRDCDSRGSTAPAASRRFTPGSTSSPSREPCTPAPSSECSHRLYNCSRCAGCPFAIINRAAWPAWGLVAIGSGVAAGARTSSDDRAHGVRPPLVHTGGRSSARTTAVPSRGRPTPRGCADCHFASCLRQHSADAANAPTSDGATTIIIIIVVVGIIIVIAAAGSGGLGVAEAIRVRSVHGRGLRRSSQCQRRSSKVSGCVLGSCTSSCSACAPKCGASCRACMGPISDDQEL